MVEPRKPEARLKATATATAEEIAEYERLLSAQFETDPSLPKTTDQRNAEATRRQRLGVLAAKIRGDAPPR